MANIIDYVNEDGARELITCFDDELGSTNSRVEAIENTLSDIDDRLLPLPPDDADGSYFLNDQYEWAKSNGFEIKEFPEGDWAELEDGIYICTGTSPDVYTPNKAYTYEEESIASYYLMLGNMFTVKTLNMFGMEYKVMHGTMSIGNSKEDATNVISVAYTCTYVGGEYMWSEVFTPFSGNERLDKLEEKFESINDYTTGINLLRGTRDFVHGTIPSGILAYYNDGFRELQGGWTTIVDDEGFVNLVAKRTGISTSSTPMQIVSSTAKGFIAGDTLTVSFEFMICDDVSFDNRANIGGCRFVDSANNQITGVGFSQGSIEHVTDSNKWYKLTYYITCGGVENTDYSFYAWFNLQQNGDIRFRKLKAERGHINNPVYSQSPLDVVDRNELTSVDEPMELGLYSLNSKKEFRVTTPQKLSDPPFNKKGEWRIPHTDLENITDLPAMLIKTEAAYVRTEGMESSTVRQYVSGIIQGKEFLRFIYSSGNTNDWREIPFLTDITAANLQGVVPWEKGGTNNNTKDAALNDIFSPVSSQNHMPDVDALRHLGIDFIGSQTTNKPDGVNYATAFTLGTSKNTTAGYRNQFIFDAQSDKILYRKRIDSGNWGAYRQLAFLSDLSALESRIAALEETIASMGNKMFEGVKPLTVKELAKAELDEWNHAGYENPEPNDIYIYLYDNNTLHFSDTPIEDHGNHSLTANYFLPKGTKYSSNPWPWESHASVVTTITAQGKIVPADMTEWFYNFTNLQNIDGLKSFKTNNARSFYNLFRNCKKLENVDALANWDTSNVTLMNTIFQNCTELSNINGLRNWSTEKVTNLQYAFSHCPIINIDDLKNWNTQSVQNFSNMFSYCEKLENVDGCSKWNLSSVLYMNSLFEYCSSLKNVNGLASWDTSNLSWLKAFLTNCTNLTDISGLENFKLNNTNNLSDFFNGCTLLSNIDPIKNWDTKSITDMSRMFNKCSAISSFAPLNNWNVSKVTNHSNTFTGTTGTRPSWGTSW